MDDYGKFHGPALLDVRLHLEAAATAVVLALEFLLRLQHLDLWERASTEATDPVRRTVPLNCTKRPKSALRIRPTDGL